MNEQACIVIPARHGSQRLPGKPLLEVGGKPLIRHVWDRAVRCREASRVIVATDDERIAAAVRDFGGLVRMTSITARTGSDRIGELLPTLDEGLIVNVQGDEPDIDPDLIDALIRTLRTDPQAGVATAAAPWPQDTPVTDVNRVKVVVDARGCALYFSRAAIPHSKTGPVRNADWPLLHLGVYAYRRAVLEEFLTLPPSPLEQLESLEQLRLLEHGVRIRVVRAQRSPHGIDTPEDLAAFERRWSARSGTGES